MAVNGKVVKTTAVKSTETAKKANEWAKMMYLKAIESRKAGNPVAWCMVGLQTEIIEAFDIDAVYTENYAALTAAKQQADPLLEAAEADGFSNLICGYVRTGIGYSRLFKEGGGKVPENTPRGGMTDPSMLLACSAICDPRFKWYQALARYQDTPYYFYDIAYPSPDQDHDDPMVRDYYINYSISQLRDFTAFCAKHTGKKLDEAYLWEKIKMAEQVHRLWWECHELRKAVPCPMPSGDMFSCIVAGMYYRCRPEALDFYQNLKDELTDRIEKGIGVIEDERYRLVWGRGLPPWHNMGLFTYFEDHGAVFVIETMYYRDQPYEVDIKTEDPIEYLARRNYEWEAIRWRKAQQGCKDPSVQLLLDFIKDYKAAGMVMHGTKSCRAFTIGQIYFKNLLEHYVKIPTLFIESDMVDARDYSKAHTEQKIDEFMEMVGQYQQTGTADD